MEPVRVLAFNLLDGAPLGRVPFTAVRWSDTINEAGSAEVTIGWGQLAQRLDLRQRLRPWRTALAVVRGRRVLHAGPVTARKWSGDALVVSCGGGWSLMGKRLVLNHALASQWINGEVLIDDDNPKPQWTLSLKGSLRGIATLLVAEALKWGPLPIDLPAVEAGVNERVFNGWDFTPTSQRLSELTQVEGGPELDFQPRLTEEGNLRWTLRGADELVDQTWQWNAAAPGQRVELANLDERGADMVTQLFGLGGRSDDLVLVARRMLGTLTQAGWPILQAADTSHSTVSDLQTLLSWLGEGVARGSADQESISLRVGAEYSPTPGDHADVRMDDPYIGRVVLPLKIVQVSGDEGEWLTVDCRIREE